MHFEIAPPYVCPVCDYHNVYDGNAIRMILGQESQAWGVPSYKRVHFANDPARGISGRLPPYTAAGIVPSLPVRRGPAIVRTGLVGMSSAALVAASRDHARVQGLNPRVRRNGNVEYDTAMRDRAAGFVKARARPDGAWQYKMRTGPEVGCCSVM